MSPRVPKKTLKLSELPEDDEAFVRLPTVLRVYPVGENTWWTGVADGRYPKPVKLSKRVVAWRVGAIRALLASVAGGDAAYHRHAGSLHEAQAARSARSHLDRAFACEGPQVRLCGVRRTKAHVPANLGTGGWKPPAREVLPDQP